MMPSEDLLTLAAAHRPLSPAEHRLIRAKMHALGSRTRRQTLVGIPSGIGLVIALCLLTILLSEASWTVIAVFWTVVGALTSIWVLQELLSETRKQMRTLRSASKRNAADVYDVRAKAFVEFGEIEDEGACYAFELETERIVFVAGQDFYPQRRFPSLDFSIIHIIDETGNPVDVLVKSRGVRTEPQRKISADEKRGLIVPDHLSSFDGPLEGLEHRLPKRTQGAPE